MLGRWLATWRIRTARRALYNAAVAPPRSMHAQDACTEWEKSELQQTCCPDCGARDRLVTKSKGAVSVFTHYACSNCGSEFASIGPNIYRTSERGKPDHNRLKRIFGIVLDD